MAQQAYVLADMTWPDMKEALETIRVAIIPTGSNEQHGPHLTFETDIANAHSMALRIGERLGPRALVVPPLPFGISPHHMSFPGTVTLRPEIFLAVVADVITSLKAHGVGKFFILNGHGGNQPSLDQFMLTIQRDLGVDAACALVWPPKDVLKERAAMPTFGHSCDLETSWSLFLSPKVVREDRLTKGAPKDLGLRHSGTLVTVAAGFHERTKNGALGDATLATYATGEAIIAPMIDAYVEFLEDFLGRGGS